MAVKRLVISISCRNSETFIYSLNAIESSGSHLRARQAERRDNHRASRRVQLQQTEEGHYELVMLEMRRAGRCRMKSQIEVLTALGTEDPSFRFSEKVLSAINEWSRSSLKVTLKVLTGDPARVILETAPNYGIILPEIVQGTILSRLS